MPIKFASLLQIYYFCCSFKIIMAIKANWDILGIATSVGCAIHCAVLPVIVSTLPIFGINIIHNSFFEWGMIMLAFVVGSYSLFHGYVRHHRNNLPVLLFSAGILFLVLKQFFSHQEYLFLFFAVCLIIAAHLLNFKYCRQSKVCSSPHHTH
ncbi:MAG: MerC domain-containing protein [Thermoproteota archaeon]|nr:MerC domain-containing protein [Thermoproteota archaeon]